MIAYLINDGLSASEALQFLEDFNAIFGFIIGFSCGNIFVRVVTMI